MNAMTGLGFALLQVSTEQAAEHGDVAFPRR